MQYKYPELALMFHIPNGGFRNIVTAVRLKAEGVRAGVADILLPVARGGYHGLFIEMKAAKGHISAAQCDFINAMRKQGYAAEVCYGWELAVKYIEAYMAGKSLYDDIGVGANA